MIDKVVASPHEAIADVPDGAMVAIGGFNGPVGIPSSLIHALADRGLRNLTIISNEAGRGRSQFSRSTHPPAGSIEAAIAMPADFCPAGYLVERGQVAKAITSFASLMRPGTHGPLELAVAESGVEIELIGQGSLSERLRAGRAGISAFYTPVGPDTLTAAGKETREFDGVPHVLETAIRPDFALIAAYQADRYGNLTYRRGARTNNPVMAGSARVTVAEVESIVSAGEIDPDHVVTPGVFVDRVVLKPRGGEGA